MEPTAYLDKQLLALAVWGVKVLAGVLISVGGSLCLVLAWIGRGFIREQKEIKGDLKTALTVINHCDGCKRAVDAALKGGLYADGREGD